jgi:hypothetical protein
VIAVVKFSPQEIKEIDSLLKPFTSLGFGEDFLSPWPISSNRSPSLWLPSCPLKDPPQVNTAGRLERRVGATFCDIRGIESVLNVKLP